MSLFQNSVLRWHLGTYNSTKTLEAYDIYKSDFLPKIANIKTSKEEQYQYGFLDDLFVVDEIAKELDPENITKHQVKAGRIFFQELDKRLEGNRSMDKCRRIANGQA